jgi:hypothetical protein
MCKGPDTEIQVGGLALWRALEQTWEETLGKRTIKTPTTKWEHNVSFLFRKPV